MKIPADGWDRDERDAVEALREPLEALQQRHATDPPLDLLRAAQADALPEPLQEATAAHLSASAWSRSLVEGFDDGQVSLPSSDEARLLARIAREAKRPAEPSGRRVWRWNFVLAAAAVFFVVASAWMLRQTLGQQPSPALTKPPDTTVAVATPPPAPPPVFQLALEKPDIKLSPAALTYRGTATENRFLAALKPAFDAYRSGDYGTADREFSAISSRYPKAVEVSFYQGVTRLFLNDWPGAIASLTTAERVADSSFAWDVAWYRAVAEERAGNLANARARLSRLCRLADVRAPTACEAVKQLPEK